MTSNSANDGTDALKERLTGASSTWVLLVAAVLAAVNKGIESTVHIVYSLNPAILLLFLLGLFCPVVIPHFWTRNWNSVGMLAVRALAVVGLIGGCYQLWNTASNQAQPTSTSDFAQLEHANLRLINVDPVAGNYSDKDLSNSELQGSTLRGVSFMGANLSGSNLNHTKLLNVDFSGSKLCAVDARAADMSQAKGLDKVRDWSYFVYDSSTVFPPGFVIEDHPGAMDPGRENLLYSCIPGQTRLLELNPK